MGLNASSNLSRIGFGYDGRVLPTNSPGETGPPFTDVGRKADQIPVRVLYQELMHAGFDLPGAIPLLLRLHEERPVGAVERRQDRLYRRHVDLKVDAPPERNFHWSRLPIPGSSALIQHDLSPVAVQIGEAFIGAVEEHREAA